MKRFLIAIVGLMQAMAISAGGSTHSDYHFTHIKSANGLPHQQVETMAFDGMGRLWIGTRNGLACYDGYSFTTYYHDPGDSTSLNHNFVIKLGSAAIVPKPTISEAMTLAVNVSGA